MACLTGELALILQLELEYFEVLLGVLAKLGQFLVAVEFVPGTVLLGDLSGSFLEVELVLFDEDGALVAGVQSSWKTLFFACLDW